MIDAAPSIFIADDNAAIRVGLERALGARGYSVSLAADGRALLDLLAAARRVPDLLLLDVMMPVMTGLEVLRAVRQEPRWSEIPVILITATLDGALPVSALRDGAVDFLTKPFRLEELIARVDVHVKRHRALRRAREQARVRLEAIDLIHELNHVATADEMFHRVTSRVAATLDVVRCSVIVMDEGERVARVAASSETERTDGIVLDLDHYPEILSAAGTGETVTVADVETSPLFVSLRARWEAAGMTAPVCSVAVIPFRISDAMLGFLVARAGPGESLAAEDATELGERVVEAMVQACDRVQVFQRLVEQRSRFQSLANTDDLTGCATRRALFELLDREIAGALSRGEPISVALLDVDDFKAVNDTFGHLAGDAVLRALGRWLCSESALNPPERAGRFGGDEFVVVLPGSDATAATRFAERARTYLSSLPFVFGNGAARASLSAGVACWPDTPAEELLAVADAALYQAKEEGRDRVRISAGERVEGALPV